MQSSATEWKRNVQINPADLPDVRIITPKRLGDDRGWFAENYRRDKLAKEGIEDTFVQDNESFSAAQGTLRGLHYQCDPHAQAKIVRVLRGAILDVAVDIRRSSPTFLKHVAVQLDAETGRQIYVPAGFAHGFCTLAPDTVIAYKVSAYYNAGCDRAIRWNDPVLQIAWPVGVDDAVLSAKDAAAPFASAAVLFD
jgi:dTDP-4-dehydrorhamnose 3,5-epimerase